MGSILFITLKSRGRNDYELQFNNNKICDSKFV